ncbi:MAG: universal stress protein [Thermomicrobiales bacterium]|nr:universal stress protein [Thermomicrobiales bacterium]
MTEATPFTILVPLDGSPEALGALPYALAVSGAGATIDLLTVIHDSSEQAAAETQLASAAQGLASANVTVTTRTLTGDPAAMIVEAAGHGGADLIVMASHGRGALGRLIHGAVADKVAREAPVPVMVIRKELEGPGPVGIMRLVLPVDGSPLAEESLPFATELAQRLGTPLVLVRAVNIAELMPPAVGMGEAIPFQLYDEAEREMRQEAEKYLEALAAELRAKGLTVSAQILFGPPASAISEVTHAGDLVILVSHERSGVARWLIGSVAEQLVRIDEAPVVLVPADPVPEYDNVEGTTAAIANAETTGQA